ncbi:hypothetical protein FQN50_006647 [Emmonsiellopsis sp. PD_5]|nr:hypothetical protein FQN50_006647 [Emmonsiellopsis sp. PD_5]
MSAIKSKHRQPKPRKPKRTEADLPSASFDSIEVNSGISPDHEALHEWHVGGVAAMEDLEPSTLNSPNQLPQIFPRPTVRPVEMPIQIPMNVAQIGDHILSFHDFGHSCAGAEYTMAVTYSKNLFRKPEHGSPVHD